MQELYKRLKDFKLSGMALTLEDRLSYARSKKLPYEEFLELLCEDELDNRRDNNYKRRYSAAKLPANKKLEDFNFSFQKSIDEREINDAASCQFIRDKHNLILIGDSGVGKTHIAIALGYVATQSGIKTKFITAADLMLVLDVGLKQGNLDSIFKRVILPYRLLIIDEFGYLPLKQEQANLLFQVIAKRYEKGSIILTSNLPFGQWHTSLAQDSTLTAAILDRVLYHSTILNIKGDSFRLKDKKRQAL